MAIIKLTTIIGNQDSSNLLNPLQNFSSNTSILSASVAIQSTIISESGTGSNSNSSVQLWQIEVIESNCSNESKTYSETTEKLLSKMKFLRQDLSVPTRYYVICSHKLENEEQVLNYLIKSFNTVGFSTQTYNQENIS